MDKIRSEQQFRKERSLFFIFLVLIGFVAVTALVHRFWNPALVSAELADPEQVKEFEEVKVKGSKLKFEDKPDDSLYNQSVRIVLAVRNSPESLYIWQNGIKIPAVKTGENQFEAVVPKYDDMVADFRK